MCCDKTEHLENKNFPMKTAQWNAFQNALVNQPIRVQPEGKAEGRLGRAQCSTAEP